MQQDVDAVFEVCKATHEVSALKMFPFSRKRFDGHVGDYFERANMQAAVVATVNEQVVGLVWVRCGIFVYSDNAKLATIAALCVDHTHIGPFLRARVFLKLISAAKALADQWGALKLSLHAMSGEGAGSSDRLFRRRGAELVGGNYVI